MRRLIPLLLFALTLTAQTPTSDWPQFFGPTRTGVYTGPKISEKWPAAGPKVLWRKEVGEAFAGPVVAQGHVIVFHRQNGREIVEALNPTTGAPQWKYDYATTYRDDFGFDEGPRAAPVIADNVVYTFGAEGKLSALDLATGKLIWSEDTMKRFGVAKGFFGAAGSPIVDGGKVVANIGGRDAGIVAFDAKTGKVLWTATKDEASYSSGIATNIGGKRSFVFFTRSNLVGLEPATGTVQFQKRWRALQQASVNAATPVIVNDPMGDLIFVSAEYGPGAGVFRVNGATLTPLWQSDEALNNHYATPVYRDGILYGFHGRQEEGQSFRAVEFRTGKVRWSEERFLAGSVMLLGDRLLILRETGELVLAAATPEGFRPITRAQILPGPVNERVRAFPALAGGLLYARSPKTLVCLDLRP